MNLLCLAALCTVFTTLSTVTAPNVCLVILYTTSHQRKIGSDDNGADRRQGGLNTRPINAKALLKALQGVEGPRGLLKELCKGFAQLFARQCTQNSTQ